MTPSLAHPLRPAPEVRRNGLLLADRALPHAGAPPTVGSVATKLTEDDLTAIAHDASRADDARPLIAELVAAVEEGRLADEADASYAFGLAADLAEEYTHGDEALSLSRRAVEKARDTSDENWTRGRHADLLLRFGHDDEGMRELHALRPLLTRDEMATMYVIEALTENGRGELAEEWLTTALATAVDIVERAEPGSEAAEEAEDIEFGLARQRRDVRRDLGLPPDDIDRDVDELDGAELPEMMFWPEAAFDQMLAAFPDRATTLGPTWDEHRATIERALQDEGPMLVEVATPELLKANLAGEEVDAIDQGPLLEWPPGRNEPCWCGSRVKYKKCCLPRARS
jgi:SEC-C motif-containing protein